MVEAYAGFWQPILTSGKAATAMDIALHVATRLRERERVEDAVVATMRQTAYPQSAHWHPSGVAQGYAGLGIMCSYLNACFPADEWDVIGHGYLELAVRDIESRSYLPAGIFGGLSGLAFAAWSLSQGGKRYRKLLATLDEALLPQAISLAQRLTLQKKDVSVGQFDLISGLSGVGAYLLCRKDEPHVATALKAVLRSLVALTAEEEELPLWYTPVHLLGDEKTMPLYPNGNLNCGLAHGIPGPLGLLSLAHISGVSCERIEETIARVATWLLQHRLDDQWGLNWPTAVRVEANGTVPTGFSKETALPFEPSRTAWCYGSPGVARALWFAGKALHNSEYQQLAIESMEAVYRRPVEVRRIDSPTFCHGVAGLLQIVLRFAHDTGLPQFTEAAHALAEQLLSLYKPDTLLGYYSLEPGGNRVDQPGLLDGVPGVVLVLLAAATPVEPGWDRLFLLS
jgi:lantibiotic modifying enzyme